MCLFNSVVNEYDHQGADVSLGKLAMPLGERVFGECVSLCVCVNACMCNCVCTNVHLQCLFTQTWYCFRQLLYYQVFGVCKLFIVLHGAVLLIWDPVNQRVHINIMPHTALWFRWFLSPSPAWYDDTQNTQEQKPSCSVKFSEAFLIIFLNNSS